MISQLFLAFLATHGIAAMPTASPNDTHTSRAENSGPWWDFCRSSCKKDHNCLIMPNGIHTCVWEGYHSGPADKCIELPPTPGKEYPKDWIICPAQPFDVCVPMAGRKENRCVERMWLHWNP